MRISPLIIAFNILVGCSDPATTTPPAPDPDPTPDATAPPVFVHDPGLEGPAFSLDDAGCQATSDRITCLEVEYSQVNGTSLHMDLYAPLAARSTPVPVIFYLHGGGWSLGTYHNPGLDLDGYIAAGYAVASVEYRLTLGANRQPSGVLFPDNIQDVKTAIRWFRIKAATFIDGSRIMAYGFSAGAHLAALAGDTAGVAAFEGRGDPAVPSTVRAVVALSAAIDFHLFVPQNPPLDPSCPPQDPAQQTPEEGVSLLIGGPFGDPQYDQTLTDLSPMTYLDASSAAMLFFAGTCDQTVPYHGAEELAALAQAQGVPQVTAFISQGKFHGQTLQAPGARERLAAFVAAQLGP